MKIEQSSPLGLLFGKEVLVTNIKVDDETGSRRIYLATTPVTYIVVEEHDLPGLDAAWANAKPGHLTINMPSVDCLFTDEERP